MNTEPTLKRDAADTSDGLVGVVRQYLKAFDSRRLQECVAFFADDARLEFVGGRYEGRRAIEEWHRSRFTADFRILRVDAIDELGGSTVHVEGVVSSKRLQAFRLGEVNGTVTCRFENGLMKDVSFAANLV